MAKEIKRKDELRLKTKSGVKISTSWFVAIIILVLATGYVAGHYKFLDYSKKDNCIPQSDFELFLNQSNTLQAEYQKCVKDEWNLQLACKMQIDAWKKTAVSLGYKENVTVASANATK